MPEVLLFIPTFNCEKQIVRVLNKVRNSVPSDWTILMVDNCSEDNTLSTVVEYLKDQPLQNRYMVTQNIRNLGLGGSHKVAFRYSMSSHFDWVVVLHGDDQADIGDLFRADTRKRLGDLNIDCYLGARFLKGATLHGYSFVRRLGNLFLMKFYPKINGERVSDMGSGLNVYRVNYLKNLDWSRVPDDLTFNNFLLLQLAKRKARVHFFPISWREEDQRSNARPLIQSIKIFLGIFETLIGFTRKRGVSLTLLPNPIVHLESGR